MVRSPNSMGPNRFVPLCALRPAIQHDWNIRKTSSQQPGNTPRNLQPRAIRFRLSHVLLLPRQCDLDSH